MATKTELLEQRISDLEEAIRVARKYFTSECSFRDSRESWHSHVDHVTNKVLTPALRGKKIWRPAPEIDITGDLYDRRSISTETMHRIEKSYKTIFGKTLGKKRRAL
jgi:hypothetical protein